MHMLHPPLVYLGRYLPVYLSIQQANHSISSCLPKDNWEKWGWFWGGNSIYILISSLSFSDWISVGSSIYLYPVYVCVCMCRKYIGACINIIIIIFQAWFHFLDPECEANGRTDIHTCRQRPPSVTKLQGSETTQLCQTSRRGQAS